MNIEENALLENPEEIAIDENLVVCILTKSAVKDTEKERTLQALIRMLNEEYGFDLADLERDFPLSTVMEDGKRWKRKIELVAFVPGRPHTEEHLMRLCIVVDGKTKAADKKHGIDAALHEALLAVQACEFGLWTNGLTFAFVHKRRVGSSVRFDELADFPGAGESLDDLDRQDRAVARVPANDSLVRTFKRCHDYIYGNDGTVRDAFWQLLYIIFCKIYDEKRRFVVQEDGGSYRRKFWVGVKEVGTAEGQAAIAGRVRALFEELKGSQVFAGVFTGNEDLELTNRTIAYIAAELARYNFLDATVDVKGVAYETLVSNTLKQERGQFFTPRNIVRAMVDMMSPGENDRVIDPACGSGGFLVMVMDHVRRKIARRLFPGLEGEWLREKFNSPEVNAAVQDYAETNLFGIDFDPALKKAARMNMVMSGDGHANIFQFNSLEYPGGANTDDLRSFEGRLAASIDRYGDTQANYSSDARNKFDLIFTNPPFGAKIPINDPAVLDRYELGHTFRRQERSGLWEKTAALQSSQPPEILFIDRCYQLLKPGGRMAIVLPDGILGNPNTEYVRAWMLERFVVLASVDLPVEAFLPQVGVQASLLFLRKKTETQRALVHDGAEDYQVFMAIAEKIGKDRRGQPVYVRDEDGAEVLREKIVEYLHTDLHTGEKTLRQRREKSNEVDDDLPRIAAAYREFVERSY